MSTALSVSIETITQVVFVLYFIRLFSLCCSDGLISIVLSVSASILFCVFSILLSHSPVEFSVWSLYISVLKLAFGVFFLVSMS